MDPRLIPVTEAARLKRCNPQSIRNAVERGQLDSIRLSRYVYVIDDAKFAAYSVRETGARLHKNREV